MPVRGRRPPRPRHLIGLITDFATFLLSYDRLTSDLQTNETVNYTELLQSVQSAAGLRLRLRLQPLYGQGEIVFPCTVAGGKYQTSPRRIPGYDTSVSCVILDSIQSQANRMEEALLHEAKSGSPFLPHVVTDFSDVPDLEKPLGEITCFEAPHRIFDAILRDSLLEGTHFPLTDLGKAIANANRRDATPIFTVSPASLLFGSWDSTGVTGGLGEKYTRCVVSEVVGINCESATRSGTRIDPLNIAGEVEPEKIQKDVKDEIWGQIGKNRKNLKRPSELNHSSVPWQGGNDSEPHGGVTCDYIQQSTTISFPALRQLHFLTASDEDASPQAHAVLAAMALHAAALNVEGGWHLRSRCDLILDEGESVECELLGSTPTKQALAPEATRALLTEAIAKAKEAGLPWNEEPVRLIPSPALQQLVIKSQQAHRTAPAGE